MRDLHWHVYCPKGELVAVTRYASGGAQVAIFEGPGATVLHGERVVLTVDGSTAAQGALPVADVLLATVYGRENLTQREVTTT